MFEGCEYFRKALLKTERLRLSSAVQKPEKLSWACVAGALLDGVRAYTALHTHARMAAGHTLLVLDGAGVRENDTHVVQEGEVVFDNDVVSSRCEALRPHVYPAGVLSRSEGPHHGALATAADFPGAASAQRRFVFAAALMLLNVQLLISPSFTFSCVFPSFSSLLSSILPSGIQDPLVGEIFFFLFFSNPTSTSPKRLNIMKKKYIFLITHSRKWNLYSI